MEFIESLLALLVGGAIGGAIYSLSCKINDRK